MKTSQGQRSAKIHQQSPRTTASSVMFLICSRLPNIFCGGGNHGLINKEDSHSGSESFNRTLHGSEFEVTVREQNVMYGDKQPSIEALRIRLANARDFNRVVCVKYVKIVYSESRNSVLCNSMRLEHANFELILHQHLEISRIFNSPTNFKRGIVFGLIGVVSTNRFDIDRQTSFRSQPRPW
ncbi:hypothetical protein EVAR_52989_1 [Eumeta japonica]|uniref:Uncharacterized protein n=1 Tax=Eumeta variegata TaxID=151549 RepID=A0A4C1YPL3_EUMVA|nr:hypothetical protein EVAR_52989_1 [Eumeta japonica]